MAINSGGALCLIPTDVEGPPGLLHTARARTLSLRAPEAESEGTPAHKSQHTSLTLLDTPLCHGLPQFQGIILGSDRLREML